ncbi:MAG TPA: hypothetical protein QGF41_02255 [Gammaproteobacteria bacterium]|nr:hypothetical protein [Gammaproteobacteria bacterium]
MSSDSPIHSRYRAIPDAGLQVSPAQQSQAANGPVMDRVDNEHYKYPIN